MGSVAFNAVDAVIAEIGAAIAAKATPHAVVMRSTLPPGSAEERVIPALEAAAGRRLGNALHYYSNPEFLREGTAVQDFRAPPYTLVGAPSGDNAVLLRHLYEPLGASLHVVPLRVAESVKYLSNAYHAVKLAFANEAGVRPWRHMASMPQLHFDSSVKIGFSTFLRPTCGPALPSAARACQRTCVALLLARATASRSPCRCCRKS